MEQKGCLPLLATRTLVLEYAISIFLCPAGSGDLQHVKKGGDVGGYRDGNTIQHVTCGELFDPTQEEELAAALWCGVSVGLRSWLLVSSNSTRRCHRQQESSSHQQQTTSCCCLVRLVHLVGIDNTSFSPPSPPCPCPKQPKTPRYAMLDAILPFPILPDQRQYSLE